MVPLSADNPKIFILAGEKSGDVLGGAFLRSLKALYPDAEVRGIGGEEMLASGMLGESLFPMDELSLMGIAEIVPQLPNLIKRIDETVKAVEAFKPDVLLTIDAPDFSFRVQKKIKKRQKVSTHQVHYVAPTVWAWREKRADKISKILDQVLCLFPFEPPYFEKVGLQADFVGHSMLENVALFDKKLGVGFRQNIGVSDDTKLLGVFLGSRTQEVKTMLSVYKEVLSDLVGYKDNLTLIIPTFPKFIDLIEESFSDLPFSMHFLTDSEKKWCAFSAMDAAMATSGTVGLELAVSGVPHLISYQMKPMTAMVARRLIKVKYAHLANIMRGEMIVPEFIQEDCRADLIRPEIESLLFDEERSGALKMSLSGISDDLRGDASEPPSMQAVRAVMTKVCS